MRPRGRGGLAAAGFLMLAVTAVAAPDLAVTSLDVSNLASDCHSLDVSGSVRLRVRNGGASDVTVPFDVVVFEDRNGNGFFDGPGIDNLLGTSTVTRPLVAGAAIDVDVAVPAGSLRFRSAAIHAAADPANQVIGEISEANNVTSTADACQLRQPRGAWTPVVKWDWLGARVETSPMVGDVNADGIPDVVINYAAGGRGVIRVMSGRDGSLVWTTTAANSILPWNQVALADLDGDPGLEIVTYDYRNPWEIVAVDDDGTRLWTSPPLSTSGSYVYGGGPCVADLDCDGTPEIIWRAFVVNGRDGSLFWTPEPGGTIGATNGALSIAVDLNPAADDGLEVVAGPTAYAWNGVRGAGSVGRILWNSSGPPYNVPDGAAAAGNFDADPEPEIVIAGHGVVSLLEGDTGALIWQRTLPVGGGGCIPAFGGPGGAPIVADFDGDGAPEIGVAAADWYCVYAADGTLEWRMPISDCSSGWTTAAAFDFDGDGAYEIAYRDERVLRVFRGGDGLELASVPATSGTTQEGVAVADVDGDGHADIVTTMSDTAGQGLQGVRVVSESGGHWVGTRGTWNEHAYHVGNITDAGVVPPGPGGGACEAPSWLAHGTYRAQVPVLDFRAPNLTLALLESGVRSGATCRGEIRLVVRVGNGGSAPAGTAFPVSFYDGDPAAGGVLLGTVMAADLAPGDSQDIEWIALAPRAGPIDVFALADDDGTGRGAGLVGECREDDNACSATVVNDVPPLGPLPVGVGPALRVTGHGSPLAATITADFDWSRDAGLPRPAGDHYHVMRGTDPAVLSFLPALEPWTSVTYTDATAAAVTLPLVHYYVVLAADRCEQVQPPDP